MPVSTTLFKRVQLFNGLTEAELADVAAICREVIVAPGEQIIAQNTTGSEMYVVAEGAADVYIQGLEDSRSLVVLGKGQVIGEMALIDQGYRSASVRATKEGATLYLIESGDFYRLCQENYHIGYVAMRNMSIDLSFKLRHRNLTEL
ncbi:MAG: cyclic nucleotide-binding domain-containing protein [Ardenticatenaceae bacterium]|nr:cyclic nucleotide-binding domain-containing protein [Anaerolineales bacterium]MCB8921067.1 cyclic nucleotide-binding domain-containing protein [Ardenticatenaceae bacterium]MCB8991169.1 cyclic nucleotide-binding domain-containing protein [Ardenticatenaceae bacterium]MCB9005377.1 cyclic nucleotide-binding domain-containing protein [Ardenticatenaceae bacterium]